MYALYVMDWSLLCHVPRECTVYALYVMDWSLLCHVPRECTVYALYVMDWSLLQVTQHKPVSVTPSCLQMVTQHQHHLQNLQLPQHLKHLQSWLVGGMRCSGKLPPSGTSGRRHISTQQTAPSGTSRSWSRPAPAATASNTSRISKMLAQTTC